MKYIFFSTKATIYILILLISNYCLGSSPKTRYTLSKYYYTIDTIKKSFNTQLKVIGSCNEASHKAVVYYGELENIESINAEILIKNKFKKISKNNYFDSDVYTSSFFSGYKTKQILLQKPDESESFRFQYNANINNKELMCLSSLLFYQEDDIFTDTIEHILEIPNSFKLLINTSDITRENNIQIDSLKNIENTIYTFRKVYTYKEIPKNSKLKNVDSEQIFSIRILVLPKTENGFDYFNNWYQNLIRSIPKSNEFKLICDSIANINPNKDSILKNAYQYVTQKIRYIDIENGINAFKPRSTQEVIHKKQGDCKDMAYLLLNMLDYLGFNANMGLSSTLDHKHQFDFPTISSANHAICIVKLNSRIYYLDATEKLGFYNEPSRQIQKTKVFLTNEKKYEILEIPFKEPKFNTINSNYKIEIKSNSVSGDFSTVYYGYSKLKIDNIVSNFSSKNASQILRKYLQDEDFNIKYNNITYTQNSNSTNVKGQLELSTGIVNYNDGRIFFNFNFCPNMLPTKYLIDTNSTEHYNLFSSNSTNYKVVVSFPNNIKKVESLYENFKIKKGDLDYNFKVGFEKNNLIIEYHFTNADIQIKKENIKDYNYIYNEILKTLNHEIIIY